MQRVGTLWDRFRSLSRADRRWVIEAALALVVARLQVIVLPFRSLGARLGRRMEEAPPPAADSEPIAERIGWAVLAVAPRLPFRALCLEQALAARRMLRRRSIPSTVYAGLDRNGEELLSHAWLRCGTRVLTGESARRGLSTIAYFGDPGGDGGPRR